MRRIFLLGLLLSFFSLINQLEANETMNTLNDKEQRIVEISMWTARGNMPELKKALTAGLLHDCGKFCSAKEQIHLCEKKHIQLTESELSMPALIHAKLGAYLSEHEYGISDPDILSAITWHTTGKPEMTMLEKIIYIADYIEPNRKMIPGLSEVRAVVFHDIDQAVCMSAGATTRYLENGGKAVDPMTVSTYNYYKKEK